jgi:hypothetical protein
MKYDMNDVKQFSLYAINKAYTKFLKETGKHPRILVLDKAEKEEMRNWAWTTDYFNEKGFVPAPKDSFFDSVKYFQDLLEIGIFIMGRAVLKVEVDPKIEGFILKR